VISVEVNHLSFTSNELASYSIQQAAERINTYLVRESKSTTTSTTTLPLKTKDLSICKEEEDPLLSISIRLKH
jgi:hypothetical protein